MLGLTTFIPYDPCKTDLGAIIGSRKVYPMVAG